MRGRPTVPPRRRDNGVAAESVLLMSQVCEFRWRSLVDATDAAQSDSPIWYN
jgi:hypothetical protein